MESNTMPAVKRPARSKLFSTWTNYLFILPIILFMLVFVLFPIVYNITLSLQDVNVYNFKKEHSFIGLANYIETFKDPVFFTALRNSIVFTLFSLAFQFGIGFALALFFNRSFPGRNVMRSLMLLAWMLPVVITGSVFQWMLNGDYGVINHVFQWLGLIDQPHSWLSDNRTALMSTIVANIWIGIPFNMIILLTGLQGMPEQLYEAAKLDGANKMKQFRHITLPLMKPTILILLMLGIINTFKVFDLIFIMTAGGPVNSSNVLPIYSYQMSFLKFEFSQGAAVSMIMFVILILLAVVYLRMTSKEETQ